MYLDSLDKFGIDKDAEANAIMVTSIFGLDWDATEKIKLGSHVSYGIGNYQVASLTLNGTFFF